MRELFIKLKRLPIKQSYLLIVLVLGIIITCLMSTYAMFTSSEVSTNNVVNLTAPETVNLTLSSVTEYKQITVSSGEYKTIKVNITNDLSSSLYYGVWYEMVSPSTKNSNHTIAKLKDTTNATAGTIDSNTTITVYIIVRNKDTSDLTINIGVGSNSTSSLGLPTNRVVISGEASIVEGDFVYTTTGIDVDSGNYYTLSSYTCDGGATVTYDTFTLQLTYSKPDRCSLEFEEITSFTDTTFDYTGSIERIVLVPGKYKLEVWGAQGGDNSSSEGGLGGYSKGYFTVQNSTAVYVAVGGQGSSYSPGTSLGGYNGGGSAKSNGGGGGGATHIATSDGLLSTFSSDSSVVLIVAGGGGGASIDCGGGYGGGTSGGSASANNSSTATTGGKGGSQSAGGAAGSSSGSAGSFGVGGGGGDGGGGGAGYYGGGSGVEDDGGGGGSGYVSTSLSNASTTAGNKSFSSTSGGTETGHSGNGYAKITKVN